MQTTQEEILAEQEEAAKNTIYDIFERYDNGTAEEEEEEEEILDEDVPEPKEIEVRYFAVTIDLDTLIKNDECGFSFLEDHYISTELYYNGDVYLYDYSRSLRQFGRPL